MMEKDLKIKSKIVLLVREWLIFVFSSLSKCFCYFAALTQE
jgi:hypothetical protein